LGSALHLGTSIITGKFVLTEIFICFAIQILKPMKRSILFLLIAAAITGCSDKVIAPKFTYVEKIIEVKPGDDFSRVKSTLGCPPDDIYIDEANGKSIYTWRYKRNERFVSKSLLDKPEGATTGDARVKNEGTLYCIFSKDYVLESLSTDEGRADAVNLILFDNSFREAVSDPSQYNSFKLTDEEIGHDFGKKKSGGLGGLFGGKK
jgi:hypothetical protein